MCCTYGQEKLAKYSKQDFFAIGKTFSRHLGFYELLLFIENIILYKKFVEHHVIKLILLKISKLSAHLTQHSAHLITWCSTNFLYKII